MDPAKDFVSFHDQLTSKLVQTTRTVGQLASEDLNFYRTSNSEISESLDEQSGRIISLTSSILKAATARTDVKAPVLENEESIEDNWRGVVDVIDALLEKADACLDEFTGIIKRLSPSQQEQAAAPTSKFGKKAAQTKFPSIYDYGPSKIPKPQLQFERVADNTDASPFRPLLRAKPHAIVSLEESLKAVEPDGGFRNPYETEIRAAKYPASTYTMSPPVTYLPFDTTTATFVDTVEGVKEMLEELKSAKEIAIDLEHHDVHSYHGLVSLMQISTRDKDWVVDTLKPWREELQILNEVFTDPSVLKVFHGSSMDIIWLQRDLGLYVVGMFDTYHAACALNYPRRSLKYLLQKFTGFEADKKYQMADWRIRPLPPGMFDYARSDTHYLLNVYDHLRNELIENSTPEENLIDYVLEQSKIEALQRYERPVYDAETGQGPGGWYDYLSRSGTILSKEQFSVFRAVHQWRDEVARAEDEGVQCVFPKHVLFKVAQVMPLDLGTLFRTLSPMTTITKDRASDLLEVIKKAKVAGAMGPEWRDIIKPLKLSGKAALMAVAEKPEDRDYPVAERCTISQFWGDVLDCQEPPASPECSVVASREALRLSLPLPPMPMTVSEAREKLAPSNPTSAPKPAAPTPAVTVEETDSNQIFTVKESSRKRKTPSPATNEEAEDVRTDARSSLDTTDNISKKARKKTKKEKKSLSSQPEEAPFDYTKAESVLNAQRDQAATQPARTFNPYAKAMDAPKGMRKTKMDKAARSFTFRK
ncbi:exosome nuclease subunit [Monascus purpureus]|uniref:Exosome nuclease subunit n=1 Tax=Monascus purpureus TaxID=5098 RepID=A0A507QVZ1_MONPU|nr:exosome nuclease subunit [Monascus purpureus]BDD56806.1 hypothetical protein MAP00_002228 [Monascus purpureus]